jgi:hypothetical protein
MPRIREFRKLAPERQKVILRETWEIAAPEVQAWFIQSIVRKIVLEKVRGLRNPDYRNL